MAQSKFRVIRVRDEDATALEAIAWYNAFNNVADALSFVINRAKISEGFDAYYRTAQQAYEAHKAAAAARMEDIPNDEAQAQY